MTSRRAFLQGASTLMAHAAFPQVLGVFLAGSASTAQAVPRTLAFFTASELDTVRVLVDLILPETDSPAASAADTHWFIDLAASACATPLQRTTLRAGLAELAAAGFATKSEPERVLLLTQRATADATLDYDASFFKILKDYTMVGYFHSEIGATRALAYERVPGGYTGDIPLTPQQKAWAI
jgi:hypothetical protein